MLERSLSSGSGSKPNQAAASARISHSRWSRQFSSCRWRSSSPTVVVSPSWLLPSSRSACRPQRFIMTTAGSGFCWPTHIVFVLAEPAQSSSACILYDMGLRPRQRPLPPLVRIWMFNKSGRLHRLLLPEPFSLTPVSCNLIPQS